MATAPLFVADVATLKSKLRLSGVPSASDADDIINEAILIARTGFYRELGSATVGQIVATAFVEDPESEAEIRRATANLLEVKWVRMELMRLLPMLFVDGSANQQQVYHDEAAFREATQMQLDDERRRLANDIELGLELLRGSSDPGSDQKQLLVDSVTPTKAPQRPGDSILPYWRNRGLTSRW
jgi:hypothetical protein